MVVLLGAFFLGSLRVLSSSVRCLQDASTSDLITNSAMKLSATILLATFAPAVWAVAFPQITDEANPDDGSGATATTTAGDGSFGEEGKRS